MKDHHIETQCIQAGYKPNNGEARVLPIYQSTTFKYDSTEHIAKLFDLEAEGFFYTRLSNPTAAFVEQKIATLEGGVGAMLTSSGQAAAFIAILNICSAGDHVISTSAIYGGTYNLFNVTLKKFGIEFTFVDPDITEAQLNEAFRPNTKAVFGETIANPALTVLDFEKFAHAAHAHHVPFIVDNTLATPILCRPFEFGVDIVVHSTSKYMDGHAVSLGGVIVDSGNFDWRSGNFEGLTTPDDSYHGTVYVDSFKSAAYIAKARVQLMRDLGSTISPHNAFLLNLCLETLHLRMEKHCANALAIATYLESHDKIEFVNYPGLEKDANHALAKKYLTGGCSGVISFGIKGGKQNAIKFMDSLKLANIVVHVADARTGVLHPATSTHRQLNSTQLKEAGISESLIRMSVGIEHVDDLICDIEQALKEI